MTHASRLAGKRCMVTGAGSGIGRAVAVRLAGEGARVGRLGRGLEALEHTSAAIAHAGGVSIVQATDVSDEAAVATAVGRLVAAWGGLDVVVGVAGV